MDCNKIFTYKDIASQLENPIKLQYLIEKEPEKVRKVLQSKSEYSNDDVATQIFLKLKQNTSAIKLLFHTYPEIYAASTIREKFHYHYKDYSLIQYIDKYDLKHCLGCVKPLMPHLEYNDKILASVKLFYDFTQTKKNTDILEDIPQDLLVSMFENYKKCFSEHVYPYEADSDVVMLIEKALLSHIVVNKTIKNINKI